MKLGNVVFGVSAVLFQEGQDAVELCAGVGLEQLLQVPVDGLPSGNLNIGVLDTGDLFSTARIYIPIMNAMPSYRLKNPYIVLLMLSMGIIIIIHLS